ncbi:MAG: class I mannose-6-phosphate isomerase [Clostridiales bacterium]|nr:class I mannose-6-phosphate isomerase [Clostridiales bacterium]
MKPFKFTPYLKSVIWGGDRIASLKNIETELTDIGESWEISGVPGNETTVSEGPDKGLTVSALIEKYGARLLGQKVIDRFGTEFPLLVKIIDARRDLSVQVHPDDALARKRHNCNGKTEMWYILDTTPDAKIYAGLCRQLDPESYRRDVEAKTIMEDITAHDSHPGDIFFLPAGRVHAIGAGNLLLEIQQTSDITYRIYDYDRRDANGIPRQLHTEQAADAIDYTIYPDYKSKPAFIKEGMEQLAKCDYFDVRLLDLNKGKINVDYAPDSFVIVYCAEGNVEVDCDNSVTLLKPGDTILVPAQRDSLVISGNGKAVTAHI